MKPTLIPLGNRPLDEGETCTVDHVVQEYRIVIRSTAGVGPETLKDLIQTKYEVVEIEETKKQIAVWPGNPDF